MQKAHKSKKDVKYIRTTRPYERYQVDLIKKIQSSWIWKINFNAYLNVLTIFLNMHELFR